MYHLLTSRRSNPLRRSPILVSWQPIGFLVLALLLGVVLARFPLRWSVLLLAAVSFAILTLIQPLFGLAITLLAGPFGALQRIILGGGLPDAGQILLMVTIAIWLARGAVRKSIRIRSVWLTAPFGLFVLLAAFSLIGVLSITSALKELLKWVEIALIILLVVDETSRFRQARIDRATEVGIGSRALVLLLLVPGLTQALIGVWQFGLRGTGPEHFGIMGGYYRAYGTFEQPNPFGGYMNLTFWLAAGTSLGILMYWLRTRPARLMRNRLRLAEPSVHEGKNAYSLDFSVSDALILTIAVVTATVSGLALLFSWSRGAWLGSAAGAVAAIIFFPRRLSRAILSLLLLGGLLVMLFVVGTRLAIVPSGVAERLGGFGRELQLGDVRGVDINDANFSVLERLAHWQAAVDMARENLWWGVGFGNYEEAYDEFALINWPNALGHAHNYYLNLLAELGVTGLLAYLIFWGAVFWQGFRVLRNSTWPARGMTLGLMAAFVALSVHHLVDKLYVNNIYLHLAVMLGLLECLDKRSSEADCRMGTAR